jgi:type VI secretion system protein VasD
MSFRCTTTVIAASVLMSACGAWQAASDSTANAYHSLFFRQVKVLNVDLTTRASLNPDEAMRPTSVAVRVYQLKDRKRFDEASYDDLLKNDRTLFQKTCSELSSGFIRTSLTRRAPPN